MEIHTVGTLPQAAHGRGLSSPTLQQPNPTLQQPPAVLTDGSRSAEPTCCTLDCLDCLTRCLSLLRYFAVVLLLRHGFACAWAASIIRPSFSLGHPSTRVPLRATQSQAPPAVVSVANLKEGTRARHS